MDNILLSLWKLNYLIEFTKLIQVTNTNILLITAFKFTHVFLNEFLSSWIHVVLVGGIPHCLISFNSVTRLNLNALFKVNPCVISCQWLVIKCWAGTKNVTLLHLFNNLHNWQNITLKTVCRSLRLKLPNENEEFNAKFVSKDESQIFFNLTNKRGEALALSLTAVENQRFRIIIEEHDRHRYNLEYSLEKEPNLKL